MWGTCISVWLSWCRRRAVDGRPSACRRRRPGGSPPTAPSTIIGSPHVVIVARVSAASLCSRRYPSIAACSRRTASSRARRASASTAASGAPTATTPVSSCPAERGHAKCPSFWSSAEELSQTLDSWLEPESVFFFQNNGGPTSHAPPLPRAAPGRPLQGLTSWPPPGLRSKPLAAASRAPRVL